MQTYTTAELTEKYLRIEEYINDHSNTRVPVQSTQF